MSYESLSCSITEVSLSCAIFFQPCIFLIIAVWFCFLSSCGVHCELASLYDFYCVLVYCERSGARVTHISAFVVSEIIIYNIILMIFFH